MCGHLLRVSDNPLVKVLLDQLGVQLDLSLKSGHFYPGSRIDGVLIADAHGTIHSHDAIWWFLLDESGKPVHRYATFNARHLDGKLWKAPIRHHRCAVIATGFGESIQAGNEKHSYLLESNEPFLVGGVYREYKVQDYVVRGLSVITRDPHARLSKYHDKATPLFIPTDKAFVDKWLNPNIDVSEFEALLATPTLRNDFRVTPVVSVKRLTPVGEVEQLLRDRR